MVAVGLLVVFMAFWLVLSGQTTAYLIGCGLVTSLAIVGVLWRKGLLQDGAWLGRFMTWGALTYFPWLLKEVVVANWKVLQLVWSPTLKLEPSMVEVALEPTTPMGHTVLANSITMTPGTVSVEVEPGSILVHAINAEARDGLQESTMAQRVRALELRAQGGEGA